MSISKIVKATLLCLLIISCGGNGTNKKREPSRSDKRKIEIIEKKKKKAIADEEKEKEKQRRNNGNHRKPSQRKREDSRLQRDIKVEPIVTPEEDPTKASAARIEKRVQLELSIWKAKDKNDSKTVSRLREEADNLAKEMTIAELNEAFKKLKDLKKRM